MKMLAILVLNDGESWSGVDGCSVQLISEKSHEDLCNGAEPTDISPIATFSLGEIWKDRQEDAHWDDKPEKDEIDEDAEYERGIELMMQGWEYEIFTSEGQEIFWTTQNRADTFDEDNH
jgi:hypothetical protein